MTRDDFAAAFDVSRETLDRLDAYAATLRKWNRAINLVSARSLDEVWLRHFADCAQIFEIAADRVTGGPHRWADLGSGAGFPGLVIAILAHEHAPQLQMTLIESDRRKCAFLRDAARQCGVTVSVLGIRAEDATLKTDTVSARALAPLADLLGLTEPLLKKDGRTYFPKGETVDRELTEANHLWHIGLITKHRSRSDPRGTVLEIGRFHRRMGR